MFCSFRAETVGVKRGFEESGGEEAERVLAESERCGGIAGKGGVGGRPDRRLAASCCKGPQAQLKRPKRRRKRAGKKSDTGSVGCPHSGEGRGGVEGVKMKKKTVRTVLDSKCPKGVHGNGAVGA